MGEQLNAARPSLESHGRRLASRREIEAPEASGDALPRSMLVFLRGPVGPSGADVSLSRDELIMINNALNEVCNGVEIDDGEFQARLGFERSNLQDLLDEIGRIVALTRSPTP